MRPSDSGGSRNHPLAPRMCAIAFLSYNIATGCMFGSFGVLVPAVETKLGVNRVVSTLGLPCVMLGINVMAAAAGVLASRVSIRLLMVSGALMNVAGYAILAGSRSIGLNLIVYGLLMGPGLALASTVLPSTLVTRWYDVNRGRALGFVSMPIIIGLFPVATSVALRAFGLAGTYGSLAAIMALLLVPLWFVIDYPPDPSQQTGERSGSGADAERLGITVGGLLRRGNFWALSIAAASVIAMATVLAVHLVPMMKSWGMGATEAAALLTASSLAGVPGPVAFGWLADRLGGARTLALLCLDSAILWAVMLLHPPFMLLLPIVALLGLHGAAIVATFGMALSEQFGKAAFGRAFGLGYLVSLPFSMLAVPAAARAYIHTGSYDATLIGLAGLLLLATLFAALARRVSPLPATA